MAFCFAAVAASRVGKVTEQRLKQIGVATVGDLQALELAALEEQFGRYGRRLHELAWGIDLNPVVPNRPTKSISAEDTSSGISLWRRRADDPASGREGLERFAEGGAGGPDRGAEAEDAGVRDPDAQPYACQPSGVVRGAYGDCSGASRAGGAGERSGGMCRSSC